MAEEAPTAGADEAPITFNIKSSSDAKYVLTLPLATTTVADLKQKLSTSEYADIPPERQRLIYSGRVLKDPDTLSVYKIKEGNTVHLVKGAASNQRQNPANQGGSGVSSTTGTSAGGTPQGAQGVPQNLAAGTGRDPLTALTGARYAGFAQMPNANMFGPDGGMGPPPDPEQMASMLENPNFASTLNEALSNPEVIEQMIRSNPMFQGPMAQQARQMLTDPNFRRMMTDPAMLRQMSEMRRNFPGLMGGMGGMGAGGGDGGFPMPGATDTTPSTGTEGESQRAGTTGQNQQQQQQQPPNPFAMFGQPGAAGAGGNPFASLFGPAGGFGNAPSTGNNATGGQTQNTGTANTSGTSQQPQNTPNAAANPFATMTQQIMQNPQLMQQMLASLSPPSTSQNPTSTNPSDASNPLTGTGAGNDQINPFAALANLQNMYGGGAGAGAGAGGAGGFNPFAAFGGMPQPQQQQETDTRAPEDRYAEQLRQLNDMGFYEFERNVEALRRAGGSVQGAVEYLLTH